MQFAQIEEAFAYARRVLQGTNVQFEARLLLTRIGSNDCEVSVVSLSRAYGNA